MRRVFGFADFRPHQQAIVAFMLAGEDVFAAVSRDPGSAIRGPGTAPAMMLDKLVAVCRGEILPSQ